MKSYRFRVYKSRLHHSKSHTNWCQRNQWTALCRSQRGWEKRRLLALSLPTTHTKTTLASRCVALIGKKHCILNRSLCLPKATLCHLGTQLLLQIPGVPSEPCQCRAHVTKRGCPLSHHIPEGFKHSDTSRGRGKGTGDITTPPRRLVLSRRLLP